MSLQISTREHDSNTPGVRIGAVVVEGESLMVEFYFGGSFRATRKQAEWYASIFVDALEAGEVGASIEADFMKGVCA